MTLASVNIEDFRCIKQARLELAPRANIIIGPNGSGKTSILEAVFVLGTGHSFRSPRVETLIRQGANAFQVLGKTDDNFGTRVMAVRGSSDSREYRLEGKTVSSAAQLASRLPVQVIDPDVHRLVEDGPNRRRRFLDWGTFHVEPRFHDIWRRYTRAVRQRNAALRARTLLGAATLWSEEVVTLGTQLAELRHSYLEGLQPYVKASARKLLGYEVSLVHNRGWRAGISLEDALSAAISRDQLRGTTSVGPHRADLMLKAENAPFTDRVSRGQQKLLACAMMIGQQLHRASVSDKPGCLLIDDPAAELDAENLQRLLTLLFEVPGQLVITGLSLQGLGTICQAQVFHVEHGVVRAMA